MKYLWIVFLVASTGCFQLASPISNNADDLKARVLRIVQDQRKNRDWMKIEACPADVMPEKGRRPGDRSLECSADPTKCLEKCNADDGDACYTLAQLIQKHDTIENDVADVLYHRACTLGIVSGCTNRAANILERRDAVSDRCASRTFEKACSQDDPWGCAMLGLVLADGIGRDKDLKGANHVLDKACEVSIDKTSGACKRAKELKEAITQKQN